MRAAFAVAVAVCAFVTTGWAVAPDPRTSCQLPPVTRAPGIVVVHVLRNDSVWGRTVPSGRRIDAPRRPAPLRAALIELFSGVTASEYRAGCTSTFREDADVIRGLALEAGHATLDLHRRRFFARRLGIVSASAASSGFIRQVARTAFQFPTVRSIGFAFDGSCKAFGDFMQAGKCIVIRRDDVD